MKMHHIVNRDLRPLPKRNFDLFNLWHATMYAILSYLRFLVMTV